MFKSTTPNQIFVEAQASELTHLRSCLADYKSAVAHLEVLSKQGIDRLNEIILASDFQQTWDNNVAYSNLLRIIQSLNFHETLSAKYASSIERMIDRESNKEPEENNGQSIPELLDYSGAIQELEKLKQILSEIGSYRPKFKYLNVQLTLALMLMPGTRFSSSICPQSTTVHNFPFVTVDFKTSVLGFLKNALAPYHSPSGTTSRFVSPSGADPAEDLTHPSNSRVKTHEEAKMQELYKADLSEKMAIRHEHILNEYESAIDCEAVNVEIFGEYCKEFSEVITQFSKRGTEWMVLQEEIDEQLRTTFEAGILSVD
ncbi:hypothetical protein BKA69DRAFT_1122571 [Paraphysoderma sedebokerense]|nr:hypothetical protein BKA69DRAFT_1122571 [Paraphysoderma sedebokerense]